MLRTFVGVAVLLWVNGAWAQLDRAAFDARIRAELEAQSPEALGPWDEANRVRETDPTKAEGLYRKVIELAPRFDHAHRRLCTALGMQNKRAEAMQACDAALALAASPENQVALGDVLLARPVTEPDARRARELAEKAIAAGGDKEADLSIVCEASAIIDDRTGLANCAGELQVVAPDGLPAAYFATISAAGDHRWAAAEAALERAHKAGLSERDYAALKARIAQNAPSPLAISLSVGLAARIVGAWLGLLALLFALGLTLGTMTLRLANRGPGSLASGDATDGERLLKRIYGAVLRLCVVYFYLSVPLLIVAVLLLGGLVLYGVVSSGHVPIKLVLVVILVVGATLWAIVRGLFVRLGDEDPGPRLDLATEPRLADCLRRVATLIEAPTVDHVFMTPGTQVAVFERGGMWRRLSGTSERCLILGAGVLEGMTVRELESILGHEHGHLRNADTAGGGFSFVVRRSLEQMLIGMARGGAATWYNPAWWFMRGFHLVFLRVAQGAGRLQEILADRWAAIAFGSEAFVRGLEKVVRRTVRFNAEVDATVGEAVKEKKPLPNLYRTVAILDPSTADKAAVAALERPPGPYDSHPAPSQRIAWVKALAAPGVAPPSDGDEPAWSLFADRAAIEERMTRVVTEILAKRGVRLPAEPAPTAM